MQISRPDPKLFLLVLLFLPSLVWASPPMRVIFVNPGSEDPGVTGPFWSQVSAFMQEAAKDLGVELQIEYANRDRLLMVALVEKAMASPADYLLLVNENSVLDALTPALEKQQRHYFLFNNGLDKTTDTSNLNYYLGELSADLAASGYGMVKDMMALVKTRPATLLALHGDQRSLSSQLRADGLLRGLREFSGDLTLLHQEHAHWSEEQAYTKAFAFFSRFGRVDMVWAANDAIAYGAMHAAKDAGLNMGTEIFFAGINWDPTPDYAPANYISYGGHMLLGAFALVLLDSHHSGRYALDNHYKQQLAVSVSNHTQTAKHLTQLISSGQIGQLDFRQLSPRFTDNPKPMCLQALVSTAAKSTAMPGQSKVSKK
ncbi:ABC transporter substrate-binding protein [Aliiglaciecola sp. CAU 1673]|uniref:ABC transporter substrate-binding protein n=1 Tax=Aliiglaciecola sp. CAU 1673 TaxID=3032595 RepID=UPI0023DA8F62|nr:ABC transporter substrate-binding protein [Aliiglaciecola sp. CAU 1673]MDF2176714.1 ABC transporter substrate-binding protein [Aliiglaciecola sp. CAU 1673]